MELQEIRGKLDERRKKLNTILEEAGSDYDMSKVKSLEGDSKAKVEAIQALDAEINDLAKQNEEKQAEFAQFEGIKKRQDERAQLVPFTPPAGSKSASREEAQERETGQKSLGDLFLESNVYKQAVSGQKNFSQELAGANVKTLMTTAAGWAPYDFRAPTFVDYPTRPLGVADIIPKSTTNSYAITYVQESAWSNAAVEVAEGSAKPEAALAVTTVTEVVRKIAVWIPVTDEQLADVPQVRDYINNRLSLMVRQYLDSEILVGVGTGVTLKGILNRSGIQTQAKGTDPTPDAIYKAITKIRVNAFLEPNAVVMHPNDWQDIRLLTTADGIYLWGSPADAGPERIWGMRVVQNAAETENTALVGDFNQADLAMREGLEVRVSDNYSDYFVKNLQVVLAELRAALLVYRPDGFCKVTGV